MQTWMELGGLLVSKQMFTSFHKSETPFKNSDVLLIAEVQAESKFADAGRGGVGGAVAGSDGNC